MRSYPVDEESPTYFLISDLHYRNFSSVFLFLDEAVILVIQVLYRVIYSIVFGGIRFENVFIVIVLTLLNVEL